MLTDLRQVLLVVHILLAMIWVGGILFVGWGVYPTVKKLTISNQQVFLQSLMKWTHKLFALAGVGVIGTGILLGTVFGPIHSWSVLRDTTYGNIFLTALLVGIFTLLWGLLVGYRHTMKVLTDDSLWGYAEKGSAIPLNKAMQTVTVITGVEVGGFMILIYLMVLL